MKLLVLAGVATLAVGASAQFWTEVGDAVDLPGGQGTVGSGALMAIRGTFGSNDDADMYCIHIDQGPIAFSATTTNGVTAGQDTQLFLFDIAGNPIAFNDDDPDQGTLLSDLTAGHALYANLAPGDYLLAVSRYDKDPTGGAFGQLFPDGPFDVVLGPLSGAPAISGWTANSSGSGGVYQIDLTGTGYCAVPEPGTFLAIGAGLVALAARRRRK